MAKKAVEARRARVALSPEHIRQLLRGENLHVRLRTLTGEEQIVEFVSPATPPETVSVTQQLGQLMDEFNRLMDITGKGARANAAGKRRSHKR